MGLFDAFFVVGVPPSRILRQAKYRSRLECNEKSGRFPVLFGLSNDVGGTGASVKRRSRLRPETLVSFPGSSQEQETRPTFRNGTTLEASMCDFCFPSGYVSTMEDVTDSHTSGGQRGEMREREPIFFTLNSTALLSASICDPVPLYCAGIRTVETIHVKRLVPELYDLSVLCQNGSDHTEQVQGGESVHSADILQRLNVLAKISNDPQKKDDIVVWKVQYCYVLVSRYPTFRWLTATLEVFRELCGLHSDEKEINPTVGVQAFHDLLDSIGVSVQAWARRTVSTLNLTALQRFMTEHNTPLTSSGAGKDFRKSWAALEAHVSVLANWIPPVLPYPIFLSARALIMLLYYANAANAGALCAYLSGTSFECPEKVRSRVTSLLSVLSSPEDNEWQPYALMGYRQIGWREDGILNMFQLQSRCGQKELENDGQMLAICDLLLPYAMEHIPMPILLWTFLLLVMETKMVISSPSLLLRCATAFLLQASTGPNRWPHAFIPILPSSLGSAILDSPVPYIAALRRVPIIQQEAVLAGASTPQTPNGRLCHAPSGLSIAQGNMGNTESEDARWRFYRQLSLLCISVLTNRELEEDGRKRNFEISTHQEGSPSNVALTPELAHMADLLDSPALQDSSSDILRLSGTEAVPLLFRSSHSNVSRSYGLSTAFSTILGGDVDPINEPYNLDWHFDVTEWDGGSLVLETETNKQASLYVPHQTFRLFEPYAPRSSSLGTVPFGSTESSVNAGESNIENLVSVGKWHFQRISTIITEHYCPWTSVLDVRKMSTSSRAMYAEDFNFVINRHLRYHLPYYWHGSSPSIRSISISRPAVWSATLVENTCQLVAFEDAGGTPLPTFLSLTNSKCESLRSVRDMAFTDMRKALVGIRNTLLLLKPICRVKAANQIPIMAVETREILERIEERNCEQEAYLEAQKNHMRSLDSLTSAAIMLIWQTRVTWPLRIICRLFNLWRQDDNRLSRLILSSREDIRSRVLPYPPRRRRASAPHFHVNDLSKSEQIRSQTSSLTALRRGVQLDEEVRSDSALPSPQLHFNDGISHRLRTMSSSTTSSSPMRTPEVSTLLHLPSSRYASSSRGLSSSRGISSSREKSRRRASWVAQCSSPLNLCSDSDWQTDGLSTDCRPAPDGSGGKHGRPVDLPPDNQVRSQWNYFVHHLLLRPVFDEWVVKSKKCEVEELITIFDNPIIITSATQSCGISQDDYNLLQSLARTLLEQENPLQTPSAGLGGWFKRRRSTTLENPKRSKSDSKARRKLASLVGGLNLPPERAPPPSLTHFESYLRQIMEEHQLLLDWARILEADIDAIQSDLSKVADRQIAELSRKVVTFLAEAILDLKPYKRPVTSTQDGWIHHWALSSVALSQWKIVLQQAFEAQSLQVLLA